MSLKEIFESNEFVITCECIPSRGSFEQYQEDALNVARAIYKTGRVHAISLTDNPGGNPALLADAVAAELKADNIETLIHFSAKDRNRNQILAQLYALERAGLHNVLFMSGDYEASGYKGLSRPVFDLDSVELVQLATDMNKGLEVDARGKTSKEKQAHFFAGAVVNPFKYTQAETIMQYLKLEKKVQAGAHFIVSQLGYDASKMQELILYLREHGYEVPVLANVFLTNYFVANLMKNGVIAGTHVSSHLMSLLEQEKALADKGAAARIERAANQVALAKHFGYRGVHLGGFGVTEKEICVILDRAAELDGSSKKCFSALDFGEESGFYLYSSAAGKNVTSMPAKNQDIALAECSIETAAENPAKVSAENPAKVSAESPAKTTVDAQVIVATKSSHTTNSGSELNYKKAIDTVMLNLEDVNRAASARNATNAAKSATNEANTTNTPHATKAQKKAVKKQFFKNYRLSRFFHKLMLTPGKGLYSSLEKRMDKKEKCKGKNFKHKLEHAGKAFLYGCKDCGDCGLEACFFQCPMASCPKNQRNGPCGGSMDGFCEVHPYEKLCIWYVAYVRACKSGNFEQLARRLVPPNDWELQNTSAWSNYTHKRDNLANTQNISIGNKHLQ